MNEDEDLVWLLGVSNEFMVFDFHEVLEATSNFSDENKLGQGGFGSVYKVRESKRTMCMMITEKETEKKPLVIIAN